MMRDCARIPEPSLAPNLANPVQPDGRVAVLDIADQAMPRPRALFLQMGDLQQQTMRLRGAAEPDSAALSDAAALVGDVQTWNCQSVHTCACARAAAFDQEAVRRVQAPGRSKACRPARALARWLTPRRRHSIAGLRSCTTVLQTGAAGFASPTLSFSAL